MPLAETLIRQLDPPVRMLLIAIDTCPDDVWTDTVDGDWPIWQHILHATYFFDMWMRTPDIPFAPPAFVDIDAAKLDTTGIPVDRARLRAYLAASTPAPTTCSPTSTTQPSHATPRSTANPSHC